MASTTVTIDVSVESSRLDHHRMREMENVLAGVAQAAIEKALANATAELPPLNGASR